MKFICMDVDDRRRTDDVHPMITIAHLVHPGGGGREGGTPIFSYIQYVGSGHFWGLKFGISIFLGGLRKNIIFWGNNFLGSSQDWTIIYLVVISMHFWVFS